MDKQIIAPILIELATVVQAAFAATSVTAERPIANLGFDFRSVRFGTQHWLGDVVTPETVLKILNRHLHDDTESPEWIWLRLEDEELVFGRWRMNGDEAAAGRFLTNEISIETSLWDPRHTRALLAFHAAETSDVQREAFAVLEALPGRFYQSEKGSCVKIPDPEPNAQGDDSEYTWSSMLARMRHEHKL